MNLPHVLYRDLFFNSISINKSITLQSSRQILKLDDGHFLLTITEELENSDSFTIPSEPEFYFHIYFSRWSGFIKLFYGFNCVRFTNDFGMWDTYIETNYSALTVYLNACITCGLWVINGWELSKTRGEIYIQNTEPISANCMFSL